MITQPSRLSSDTAQADPPAGAPGAPPAGHPRGPVVSDAPAGGGRPVALETRRLASSEVHLPAAARRSPEYLFRPALIRATRERMLQRRRRTAVLLVLLAAAGLVVTDLVRGGVPPPADRSAQTAATSGSPSAAADRPPAAGIVIRVTRPPRAPRTRNPRGAASVGRAPGVDGPGSEALEFPVDGPGTWTYPAGVGPVRGRAGVLRRFRVAVEDGAGQNASSFARSVDAVLADPRGWTASGRLRLQRVPRPTTAEFTIYLATPGTSERMCAAGGLHTERLHLVPAARPGDHQPGPLADGGAAATARRSRVYRAYAINHEVGHQLGHGHEACPAGAAGAGDAAADVRAAGLRRQRLAVPRRATAQRYAVP